MTQAEAEGQITAYTYDAKHNPLTVTVTPKSGSGLDPLVTTMTYETSFNKVATVTDPLSRVTSFDYDASGNLETVTHPDIDSQDVIESFTYNSRGQVLTATDAEGRVSCNTYDGTNFRLTATTADCGGEDLVTSFGYDSVGNLTTVTDPLGHAVTSTFNSQRLVTQTAAPSPFTFLLKLYYDANDRPTLVRRDPNDGGATAAQDTTAVYDLAGNIVAIADPLGYVSTYEYDALDRLAKATDAESRTVRYVYDIRGFLVQTIDHYGNTENYTFTDNGLVATVADRNGNLTEYAYDGFDRLTRTTYEDSTYEELTYNAPERSRRAARC